MHKLKKQIRRLSLAAILLSGVLIMPAPSAQAATCVNPPSTYGLVTVTYSVPAAGTYRVWTRMQAPDGVNNSFYLQVDGGCPITVGDSGLATNQLTWVDWKDGNAASKVDIQLTAGAHTFVLTGREPGVVVDRVVLNTNAACIPQGTGDTCTVSATPTPVITPTPVPVGTPTPTPVPGSTSADVNSDGRVNVFDLSILLSNWGKSGTGDIDRNGVVNVFDLSKMLTSWTG